MTIGWSFIENFENDSQIYKHTSRNVSEQKRCTRNEKYDANTNSCVECESGTYQPDDNHTLVNCKINEDLILKGYNHPRTTQNWNISKIDNKNSIEECRQHVLDEKKKGNKEYNDVVVVGHRNSKHRDHPNTCWYIRNNDASGNTTVNAIDSRVVNDEIHTIVCVDSDGNPIECNTSKDNCIGDSMEGFYYSKSDNLCKPQNTCKVGQRLDGASGTSAGTCKWIPVDCVGKWGPWDECNTTCGTGTQSRTYSVSTEAAHGGKGCGQGDGRQTQSCYRTSGCAVDCVGRWVNEHIDDGWGECSTSCGYGTQSRTYSVSTKAANGGKPCPSNETRSCYRNSGCPVNCRGEWGAWSYCSNDCGRGEKTRKYYIRTWPQNGGASCPYAHHYIQKATCWDNDGCDWD